MSIDLAATNADRLVKLSVCGEIISPKMRHPHSVDAYGKSFVLPKYGGIAYNVQLGMPAIGWMGDHVEPGVSIKNLKDSGDNGALVQLSCVGNDAKVISGDAKGAQGKVTGCHGGVDHCLIHFEPEVLEQLAIGDRIQVISWGQGLELCDPSIEDLTIMNCDPRVFTQLVTVKEGALEVPVTTWLEASWMGSGLGFLPTEGADFDICTADRRIQRYLADSVGLRLGDIVCVKDHWCAYGFTYYQGAITVGVIIHCDSLYAGHGPGVRVLMTSRNPAAIRPVEDKRANILRYL
jgi:hypothetical protein